MTNVKSKGKNRGKSDDVQRLSERKENIIIGIILTSPLWLLFLIWGVGALMPDEKPEPPKYHYDYKMREPDFERHPAKTNTTLIDTNSTIHLKLPDGTEVDTKMSSEEILQQLSLDYQDLYDYYGGAEELY